MKRQRPINLLNLMALSDAQLRGAGVPIGTLAAMRRFKRKLARDEYYRLRNASYPHSSKRQHARYARQGMHEQQQRSHDRGQAINVHMREHLYGVAA